MVKSNGKSPESANKAVIFTVKLAFAAMIVTGLVLVNPALFKLLGSSNKTTISFSSAPQPVSASTATRVFDPSLLIIPSLNITAPFEPLGLQPSNAIEVPKNNMGVGWFKYGAKPGAIGSFVVVGHLDSAQGRAIFADLSKIKPGDKIFVRQTDSSLVIYRVDSLSKFPQNSFPTQSVYGPVSYAGIRLITCGGTWNKKIRRYSDNLVVFGSKIN